MLPVFFVVKKWTIREHQSYSLRDGYGVPETNGYIYSEVLVGKRPALSGCTDRLLSMRIFPLKKKLLSVEWNELKISKNRVK